MEKKAEKCEGVCEKMILCLIFISCSDRMILSGMVIALRTDFYIAEPRE
jgi:hypothetical protein